MNQSQRDKQAYLNATPMQREVVRRNLCDVLGCLRAMYLSYQTSHWQVVGGSFYGNHLLFQRLYKSVEEQVDSLAEKISGYLGSEAVSLNYQMRHISEYTYRWSSIGCNHKRGLQSEADLQQALKRAYDGIKQAQAMSLGLDDWIMATANAHEENEYLLQQALAPIPGEGKQAARQPRSRKDLIGFFYALHDALEKDFSYTAQQINAMDAAELKKSTARLSDSLARTDAGADGAVERAMENAPAAYRQLSRMNGNKLASYDRYPSIRVPRGWRPPADQSEGCSEEHLEDVESAFTKTVETFLERVINPALKQRGWDLPSYGVVGFDAEEGAFVEVELRAKAGQKIHLGGRKHIVLDRNVSETLKFSAFSKMEEVQFEGSEQFDVDEFAEWTWDADCPTDEIESLYYKPHSFAPTPKGVEGLLAAFDPNWIRSSGIRSKVKKQASGVSIAEVERFIKRLRTYMEPDGSSSQGINLTTREDGDIGEEKPGRADFSEAQRVGRAVLKEFGKDAVSVDVDYIDEWVTLEISLKGGGRHASGAPSAEGAFYKAPNQRAVLDFAESNAISNSVEVAEKASREDNLDVSEAVAVADAKAAPPLPTEIARKPGGEAVSTLNQYVIQSVDPVAEDAVPMNLARMAHWLKELG